MKNRQNEKKKGFFKQIADHPKISLIVAIIIMLGVMVIAVKVTTAYMESKNPEVEHEEKVSQLTFKDIGELVTQESYVTVVEAMNENRKILQIGVPFTESVCIFSHDFIIKAGYDFEKIIPESVENGEEKTIIITLPEAKILSNGMVPNKEMVYYENESMFNNLDEKSKANLRTEMGKKAQNIAIENGLLDSARDNAEKLLRNFINNIPGYEEYKIVFEYPQEKEEK